MFILHLMLYHKIGFIWIGSLLLQLEFQFSSDEVKKKHGNLITEKIRSYVTRIYTHKYAYHMYAYSEEVN